MPAATLRTLYDDRGQSLRKIACALDCGTTAVQTAFTYHGIQRRPCGSGRSPITETMANDVVRRYRAGGHVPGIAAALDFPRAAVRASIPAALPRPQRRVSDTSITPHHLRAECCWAALCVATVYPLQATPIDALTASVARSPLTR